MIVAPFDSPLRTPLDCAYHGRGALRLAAFAALRLAALAQGRLAQDATRLRSLRSRVEWRKRLGVEPSPPAQRGKQPILKTGRATGPRSLPKANYRAISGTRQYPTDP